MLRMPLLLQAAADRACLSALNSLPDPQCMQLLALLRKLILLHIGMYLYTAAPSKLCPC